MTISFKELNINKEPLVTVINYNSKDIEVKHYVDLMTKQAIIDFALAPSKHLPCVNKLIADSLLSYYTVFAYSNIELSEEDEMEPIAVYDMLEQSGLIDAIFGAIPEVELNSLIEAYERAVEDENAYKGSIRGALEDFISKVPAHVDSMNEALQNFNPEQYEMLKSFTTAVGGGSLLD